MDLASSYRKQQAEMVKKLIIHADSISINLSSDFLLLTIDIQYKDEWGYVGIDCLEWESGKHQMYLTKEPIQEAYTPGFFAFREGPIVQQSIEKLISQYAISPSLLILDGHGTAHPRKMGLASWLGIKMGIPSIGVAKESLLKVDYSLDETEGAVFDIKEGNETIGTVLRTQTGIKPIFVSAGHLISQKESVEIVKKLRGTYRLIEPIRRADHAARRYAKGEIVEGGIILS